MLAAMQIIHRKWVFPFYNSVNLATFRMYLGSYVCLRSTRLQGLAPDREAFEKHIADLSGKLDVYDKVLSKQKYLLGDVRFFWLIHKAY